MRQLSKILIFLCLAHVFRATILVRQRSSYEFISVDIYAGIAIFIVLTICILLFFINWARLRFYISKSSIEPYMCLLLICLLSATWSTIPKYSAYRAVEYISLTLAVFVGFYYYNSFDAAERNFLWISAIIILFGFGLNLRLWGYEKLHTNSYSASAVILFSYCYGEILRWRAKGKNWLIFFCLFSMLFIIIGTSAASNMAALAGLLIASILCRNMWLTVFCILTAIIGTLVMSPDNFISIVFPGKDLPTIQNFAGRRMLWDVYYYLIKESPIWGHGFTIGVRTAKYYATNAHNFLLSILLSTGLIGLIFTLWVMVKLIFENIQNFRLRKFGAVGATAAFTAALVNAMSISFIGDYWMPPTMSFTLLLAFHTFYIYKSVDQNNQKDSLLTSKGDYTPETYASTENNLRDTVIP